MRPGVVQLGRVRVEPPLRHGEEVRPVGGGVAVLQEEEAERALVAVRPRRCRAVGRVGEHGGEERDGPRVDAQEEDAVVEAVRVRGQQEVDVRVRGRAAGRASGG